MDKDYSKFDLPSEYWAKFRDISNIIDNNFNKQGYTDMDGSKEQSRRIKKYMKEHPEINTGDILFVGTDYDRGLDQGFIMVDKRKGLDFFYGEQCHRLPFYKADLKEYLISNGKKYENLYTNLRSSRVYHKNHKLLSNIFQGKIVNPRIKKRYRDNKLWL